MEDDDCLWVARDGLGCARPVRRRGMKIPIMLRKAGDDLNGQYKLVGEYYCHGLRVGGAELTTGAEETIEVV